MGETDREKKSGKRKHKKTNSVLSERLSEILRIEGEKATRRGKKRDGTTALAKMAEDKRRGLTVVPRKKPGERDRMGGRGGSRIGASAEQKSK